MSTMPPFAMLNYLRKSVGYDDYLKEYGEAHGIDYKELLETANEIMDSAAGYKTYDEWKKYIEEYTYNLKESYQRRQKYQDAVVLTTMHGSKGLEYDTVFIVDANEGITPHKKATTDTDIEEERRMFYVAMTRAKKNLHIYYPKEKYNKEMTASRFVQEIMVDNNKA